MHIRLAFPFILIFLSNVAAMGYDPMTATIRFSSGDLYDYIVIGENPKATDGFDNAYDTIFPGNLNADMGDPFVSTLLFHPEWKLAVKDFRGDVRAPATRQEWRVTVASSLPRGTPLAVELQRDRTALPKGMKLLLKGEGASCDPAVSECVVKAPGPGNKTEVIITAEQP